ncbi:MAG TPA: alpha/beta fold hydrolase, partial [Flavobacterium sp.]|nr:alpha/beta fold hydrolase [Flavobacterium sp.]
MELYSKIEGTGKPLLILHGFLGMSDNWKTLGTRFATDGFEVHMLDLRNHGRSPHSENFTYQDMSDDIKKYCDARALPRVSVIGHSMGGKAAMFFAAYNPNIVDKLVIADIGPQYYRPHHQDILAGLNAVDFTQVRDRSDVEEVLSAHIPEFGTRQFLMKSLYRKTPTSFDFRFNLK